MKVTYLDTVTGKTAEEDDLDTWVLSEGNWSCDCNRARAFGLDLSNGICLGNHRFIVIKTDSDASLEELNNGYPVELLKKHGIVS